MVARAKKKKIQKKRRDLHSLCKRSFSSSFFFLSWTNHLRASERRNLNDTCPCSLMVKRRIGYWKIPVFHWDPLALFSPPSHSPLRPFARGMNSRGWTRASGALGEFIVAWLWTFRALWRLASKSLTIVSFFDFSNYLRCEYIRSLIK